MTRKNEGNKINQVKAMTGTSSRFRLTTENSRLVRGVVKWICEYIRELHGRITFLSLVSCDDCRGVTSEEYKDSRCGSEYLLRRMV